MGLLYYLFKNKLTKHQYEEIDHCARVMTGMAFIFMWCIVLFTMIITLSAEPKTDLNTQPTNCIQQPIEDKENGTQSETYTS